MNAMICFVLSPFESVYISNSPPILSILLAYPVKRPNTVLDFVVKANSFPSGSSMTGLIPKMTAMKAQGGVGSIFGKIKMNTILMTTL